MRWANVGKWLVWLVDGWHWHFNIGPTLDQRWQMVGLVGRWLALAFQHWANVGPATVHQL